MYHNISYPLQVIHFPPLIIKIFILNLDIIKIKANKYLFRKSNHLQHFLPKIHIIIYIYNNNKQTGLFQFNYQVQLDIKDNQHTLVLNMYHILFRQHFYIIYIFLNQYVYIFYVKVHIIEMFKDFKFMIHLIIHMLV